MRGAGLTAFGVLRAAAALIAAAALAGGCGEDDSAAQSGDLFDAERAFADVEAQVRIGPRESGSPGGREEVMLIESSLREAGVEDVRVQSPHANVMTTHPAFWALDLFSRTPATTPSPNRISTAVPTTSPRNISPITPSSCPGGHLGGSTHPP